MEYKITRAVPQLPSINFERSKEFYIIELGCRLHAEYDDLLILFLDTMELHLWQCFDQSIPDTSSCYIRVNHIEILYEKYKHLNSIRVPLKMQPWGIKEFYIKDDSGNLLKFGEEKLLSSE